jgi:DNA-directed RNA polymerase specialized sigma24 family protein
MNVNQERIAEVVGVSIVTIRSRYKEFLKNLNPELKDQISCNHPPYLAQRSGGQDKIFA